MDRALIRHGEPETYVPFQASWYCSHPTYRMQRSRRNRPIGEFAFPLILLHCAVMDPGLKKERTTSLGDVTLQPGSGDPSAPIKYAPYDRSQPARSGAAFRDNVYDNNCWARHETRSNSAVSGPLIPP